MGDIEREERPSLPHCVCRYQRNDAPGVWIPCTSEQEPDSPFCDSCSDRHSEWADNELYVVEP